MAEERPDARHALLVRAERALAEGRLEDAERDARGALALAPDDPRALWVHAALAMRRGRAGDALAALRRAERAAPDDPMLLNSLGIALKMHGDRAAAVATLQHALACAPTNAGIAANLGKMLIDGGALEEGIPHLVDALARAPALTHARFTLAYAYRALGRAAEAATELRAILARDAGDGDAWLALADLGSGLADDELAALCKAAEAERGTPRSSAALRFACARSLESVGRYDEAWPHYVDANRRLRTIESWNAAADTEACDRVDAALGRVHASAPAQLGSDIVFVVGMPRSGSTLIEQILASHPDVSAGGENAALPTVIELESRRRGESLDLWAPSADAGDWERLGRDYLARTASLRASRPRLTDKRPGNWRFLGAIRHMLPGARIVVCRRDPVETALGGFVRLFPPGTQRFAYDLADLATCWRSFDRTVRNAVAREPAAIREQHLEALIADPESEIRALLAYCALRFDPACLRFHETERAIDTQSALQVRERPRAGLSRAACYRDHIAPLRRFLDENRGFPT